MWIVLALGCSNVPVVGPGVVVKSTPVPPTVDLIAQKRIADLEVVKHDPLVALFPPEVGLPPVLDGFYHHMAVDRAIALLSSLRHHESDFVRTEGSGEFLVGATLLDFPGVGVTLHLEPLGLEAIDLSIPAGSGEQVMLARWGEPPTTLRDDLGNVEVYLWASLESGMSVQLHRARGDKQVAEFKWVDGIQK